MTEKRLKRKTERKNEHQWKTKGTPLSSSSAAAPKAPFSAATAVIAWEDQKIQREELEKGTNQGNKGKPKEPGKETEVETVGFVAINVQ